MTGANMAGKFFEARFNEIQKEIPFNPEWVHGDYFDGAVDDVKLAPGEEAKSISQAGDDRKLIFVGTQLGTIVLFQRYTGDPNTIVRNIPTPLTHVGIIPTGQLSYDHLTNILDYRPESNIGSRLARAFVNKKK